MAHSFVTCFFCGKREDFEAFRLIQTPLVSKMRAEQLCFDCAYWKTWLSTPEPDTVAISGQLYKLSAPFFQPNMIQARAKDLLFVIDVSRIKVYACRGLVLRGDIPSQFRNEIPDQYKFITKDEYGRIYRYNAEMCLLKGCFDRYDCIWYRQDIAEPDEPWNTIPKNYVTGSEDCPSFVNKNGKRNH